MSHSTLKTFLKGVTLALTCLLVLPAWAAVLFAIDSYISDGFEAILPFAPQVTEKILFAVRAVIIAITISLTYFYLSNFMNLRLSNRHSNAGLQVIDALQP